MQNLPFDFLLFGFALLGWMSLRKHLGSFFTDLVSIGEDRWSWTTETGELYEDAEIERIEIDELILRHRFGTARLSVDHLSETSRQLLLRTPEWRNHLSSVPVAGRIAPFIVEPVQATQAA